MGRKKDKQPTPFINSDILGYDDSYGAYNSLHNYCDIDYSTDRCGTIYDTKLNSIHYYAIAEAMTGFSHECKSNPIAMYALERLLRLNLPKDVCTIKVSGGYYGEEIGGIEIEKYTCETLLNKIKQLETFKDDPTALIEMVLTEEYSRLNPNFANKKWELVQIPIKDIKSSSVIKKRKNFYDQISTEFNNLLQWAIEYPTVILDSQNQIIDGHHRISALESKTSYVHKYGKTLDNFKIEKVFAIKVKGI